MNIAKCIDHTLLKAEATREDIVRLCREAREHGFAAVCVNSCHAALVAQELQGSGVNTCCVVGFPLGAASTKAKAAEARDAVENGASEIDMVINIGALKSGDEAFVCEDIKAVVEAAGGAAVKVIIEACLLTDKEKIKVCELSVQAGAAFVKTSTGFSAGGATVHDVALMVKAVAGGARVKASGGVRTAQDARAMLQAGARRIGTSNGVAIVTAWEE